MYATVESFESYRNKVEGLDFKKGFRKRQDSRHLKKKEILNKEMLAFGSKEINTDAGIQNSNVIWEGSNVVGQSIENWKLDSSWLGTEIVSSCITT